MTAYLYPTESGWFETSLNKWKNSGKRYFCFPFLRFEPKTLPVDPTTEFWLYLYYTETSTVADNLRRVIQYRAQVVQYSFDEIKDKDLFYEPEWRGENTKIFFKCATVEELRKINGEYLKDADFQHRDNKALLQAIRNSIAPVERLSPALTVQRTMYWLND